MTDPYIIKTGVLSGEVIAPPSKSVSHRLLILAALSGKACEVHNLLLSEDLYITVNALKAMGYGLELKGNTAFLTGKREIPDKTREIYFGDSGTSARLLTAVAGAQPGKYLLDGSPRMRQRPMEPLIHALQKLGVSMKHQNGYLPIKIEGRILKGGEVEIDVSQSSQYLSALMLIAPLTETGLRIIPSTDMASKSYSDLTLSMLSENNINVHQDHKSIFIEGNHRPTIHRTGVEGDYSSAAYFAVGSAISGGKIYIKEIKQDSRQGDRIVLDLLKKAGAIVHWDDKGAHISGSKLKGITVNMYDYPDLVPTVAIMALFAEGFSRFRRVSHLKMKESDRINAIITNINNLGGSANIDETDLVIQPKPLKGTFIRTFNDHRIAMSFALVGLRVPEVKIENPDCVKKSFPDFWNKFEQLVKPI
jgi:3-phosphoshikimate 1-carboxyvinyltransferase